MKVKKSFVTGLSFGSTSGIITTLGLIIGLTASGNSKLVVIGGILTIAAADAFSDALGIHISEESDKKMTNRYIWEATVSTFASKFVFALTFVAPVLILQLEQALFFSIVWGFTLLVILSIMIARQRKQSWQRVVGEHLFISLLVILITYFIGKAITTIFNQ